VCNPRRIRVKATREIRKAWKAEIEQAATARRDVTAEARLVQSIGDLLPPPAKAAFEAAMRADPRWELIDGEYRRAVPGGHTAYRPDTGELEIVIQLSAAIEEVATHTLVASGEVTDEVTTEAVGTYYTDGFRGRTKKRAATQAKAAAEKAADALADRRGKSLELTAAETAKHELNERAGQAREMARLKAEEKLTLRADEVKQNLDQEAGKRLEAVQQETLAGVFELVARGYSAALQAYAAEHGENLVVTEEDGVIQIQFEMET
jgi:hypothetical protein